MSRLSHSVSFWSGHGEKLFTKEMISQRHNVRISNVQNKINSLFVIFSYNFLKRNIFNLEELELAFILFTILCYFLMNNHMR